MRRGHVEGVVANKINPVGSEFQVNSITTFAQGSPSIAALTDGRFAIVYDSSVDAAGSNFDIHSAFVNANGSASVTGMVYTAGGEQGQPATAGRLDGGFGVAWIDELTAAGVAD